eukprot:TRINITY_DN14195_c0_g1_i2.p1 TRINITY_DN14195_c0_g1~~TRINITY_DN14195_c0_g1_i2.p1  ORF type:complete len:251 (-),score=24.53 TRINITY_DN14195_c0_g1_i2:91-843(-)
MANRGLLQSSDETLEENEGRVTERRAQQAEAPRSPLEGGPWDIVRRPEFYLLWLSAFALQSGGLFLTINLGSMVQARNNAVVAADSAVTVFACAQGFARLVTGSLSNLIVQHGWPRTWYLSMLMILMAAGHGILCCSGPAALYIGTAMGGWAFGSCFPLLVLIVSEVFGSHRVASNYMIFDGSPGAVGALVFAKLVAQAWYKANAGADGRCYGERCFLVPHISIVALQTLAAFLAVILSRRVRNVYASIT